jgi:hypothetical protein
MAERIFSEWFGSKPAADQAGDRLRTAGHSDVRVRYAMAGNGRHDWLLESFAPGGKEEAGTGPGDTP